MTTTSNAPQVAINDIGSAEDLLAAIDATIKYFNDGDLVEGTVVKVDRDEVLLDIGYKTEGVIPSRELSIKHDVDPDEVVAVGDTVEALVLTKEDKEGRLILSKKRAQYERAWGDIEKIKEEDGVVEGTVIEVVKGGLILDIGLRGFLPASLVEMRRVRDLAPYIGQKLEAKIIELDKNRNNVVLSRRQWLEQTQSEVRSEFLNQLQKGAIRKGVVSSIVNFGAFVDLGGVDGLVHVSELSWKHIDHPSEVVEVGDEVTVGHKVTLHGCTLGNRILVGMGSIVMLMGLVFYVAAVMATQLFGESFPEWFGNIGASLIGSEGSRGLASHPGIVGGRFRKAHVFDYPQGEAQLLLLFSDGLQSRWSLRDYPGLIQRHPAIIATLLHRDFCRGRDDVTVLALNLEAPRG